MKEKLIIRNFGPIKNVELELGKINVLIGEHGTGKSTVAKLLTAIYGTASGETLGKGALKVMRLEEYGKLTHFKTHLKVYEIDTFFNDDSSIIFNCKLFDFELKNNQCAIKSEYSISELFDKIGKTFIPADRVAVNLFTTEVLFASIENELNLPGYFVNFGGLFGRLKRKQEGFDFSGTLGVKYKFENNQDKIEIRGGKVIKMSDASSAIQTNIPLLVVLNHQSNSQTASLDTLKLTVIEEPELNCFPVLQSKILNYIVECSINDGRQYFITTHSPYILTSLNNLMYAYQLAKDNPEKIEKVVDRKYWLNPDEVSAYLMLGDDEIDYTCEDIFSREESLIHAQKIDGISRILNEEFDKLINIELGITKPKEASWQD